MLKNGWIAKSKYMLYSGLTVCKCKRSRLTQHFKNICKPDFLYWWVGGSNDSNKRRSTKYNSLIENRNHLRRVGVRMTQRQNDTVRHFDTEGHFGTTTKWHGGSLWHGASLWHGDKMTRCVTLAQRQNDTLRHFGTEGHFGTAKKWHATSLWHGVSL